MKSLTQFLALGKRYVYLSFIAVRIMISALEMRKFRARTVFARAAVAKCL